MRSKGVHLTAACLLVGTLAESAHAQVFSSEFFSDPVSEGWEQLIYYCEPQTWNDQGWYHQQLDHDACPPGPEGAADAYRRSLEPFNGMAPFFAEFRLGTDGDRSGIFYGSPTVVAMDNVFGVLYHVRVARDLVTFFRDADLPGWLIDIEPDVPHTYRIELHPDRYAFYIDASLIDEGVPEGPFPAHDSRISWIGESWNLPCENAWDYIRYGVIPLDASGDYDSDGAITQDDFYFFHECLANDRPGIHGGPGNDAGPGCRFADFDSDSDTDLLDFAEFQNAFTSSP
jgi:hypothetical protein